MKRKVNLSENLLRYKKSATCFNDALPLGNGRIGAMIYGGVKEEKISMNDDTLWAGYPRKQNIENYPEIYKKLRELVFEDETAAAQELFESSFGDYLVQRYLPLGAVITHLI